MWGQILKWGTKIVPPIIKKVVRKASVELAKRKVRKEIKRALKDKAQRREREWKGKARKTFENATKYIRSPFDYRKWLNNEEKEIEYPEIKKDDKKASDVDSEVERVDIDINKELELTEKKEASFVPLDESIKASRYYNNFITSLMNMLQQAKNQGDVDMVNYLSDLLQKVEEADTEIIKNNLLTIENFDEQLHYVLFSSDYDDARMYINQGLKDRVLTGTGVE